MLRFVLSISFPKEPCQNAENCRDTSLQAFNFWLLHWVLCIVKGMSGGGFQFCKSCIWTTIQALCWLDKVWQSHPRVGNVKYFQQRFPEVPTVLDLLTLHGGQYFWKQSVSIFFLTMSKILYSIFIYWVFHWGYFRRAVTILSHTRYGLENLQENWSTLYPRNFLVLVWPSKNQNDRLRKLL